MKISPARLAAFEILVKIESEGAFSSNLLPLYEESLSDKDRSLCHELTLGTLRRQMYLDKIIEQFSKAKKFDVEVLISLRLGLYQLLFLDRVPDYSAINESVDLVKKAKKQSASGLVNAILRRATRETPVLNYVDDVDRVSIETSHPRWLVERWMREFGTGDAFRIAASNNNIPRIAFRKTNVQNSWNFDLAEFIPSEFVDGCLLADRFSPALQNLEREGSIYLQDEASQMVAASIKLADGEIFLDVCASPGSKTTGIALIKTRASIFAGDVSDRRVIFLKSNCEKQGVSDVKIAQYDASVALPFVSNSFDTVLVDAPCTGTGTIRHNPEIRYRLKPDDLIDLPIKQLKILTNASNLVKAGGSLIYSTCSLEREENETVCNLFLKLNSNFRVSRPRIADQFVSGDGFARTFPHRDNMDGFFIAVLQKQSV